MTQPVTHMLPRDMQLTNESLYSKKAIDCYIDREIRDNPDMEAKVIEGMQRLEAWRAKSYYDSKNARLAQLDGLDLEEVVRRIYINVAYCQLPELFTSVTGRLAGVLRMSEKGDGITTIGEMLAVLCLTDVFDIMKENAMASLKVQSHIPLSERLIEYVSQARYLPPMVCEPAPVTHNFESPYLTENSCLILGKGNGHTEDICRDVINTQNQVPLSLNLEMLTTIELFPKPGKEPVTPEDQEQWHRYKVQTYEVCHLMAKQGNRFWLTNKVDKRGRLYCQGYQINLQGSGWHKAVLDYADRETVEGVPDSLRLPPRA